MKKYQRVVLALELEPKTDSLVIKKAKEFVAQFQSKLTLVHAMENLSSYGSAYGVAAGIDLEQILHDEAKQAMSKVAKSLDVDSSHQVIKAGPAKHVITEEAKERSADLIIVGSHGKHGVQLLLGSTANGVLHAAECDVLAVRIED
jgi:universal stress protein A